MLCTEPRITVGLIENAARIDFELQGEFMLDGRALRPGRYQAIAGAENIELRKEQATVHAGPTPLQVQPAAAGECFFTLHDIAIGRDFHWQRLQAQRFRGELLLDTCGGQAIAAINRIGLESYLEAVICSEMNPQSDPEFLKAHCVISRSWLLAQLALKQACRDGDVSAGRAWTDAAAHAHFDVCNDDHCQRYHGIARVNLAAQQALAATRGRVLMQGGEICDTRFSKCCGGITERFSTCWQDMDFNYLMPAADCAPGKEEFSPPVSSEDAARRFIFARPDCFCNVTDRGLLARVLPDFDFETQQFFRWRIEYSQEELHTILLQKTGIDFGAVHSMTALARGDSGRISRLKISGTKAERVIGKELAIRRALSASHLYSSAFIAEAEGGTEEIPGKFILRGAGWGHGVGLCQIGAAAMAARGFSYEKILAHYFRGAALTGIY